MYTRSLSHTMLHGNIIIIIIIIIIINNANDLLTVFLHGSITSLILTKN